MSELFPPDDLQLWPENPYELFGINSAADEREVRRAYHRLIRRFKPEHAPEAFRRISEAYDCLKRQAYYRRIDLEASEDEESDDATEPTTQDAGRLSVRTAREIDAWQIAREGDLAGAVQQLRQLIARNPRDEEAQLRAYWLSRLNPAESPEESLRILEVLLRETGFQGRGFMVYLMELERLPDEAIGDRVRELLFASALQPRVSELAQVVWGQCFRAGKRSRLVEDLARMKQEVVFDAPHVWRQLLQYAAEILGQSHISFNDVCFSEIRREIDECPDDIENDWIDQQWQLVLRTVQSNPKTVRMFSPAKEICELARLALNGRNPDLRRRLQGLVSTWEGRPEFILEQLVEIERVSPITIYVLSRVAHSLRPDDYRWYQESYVRDLTKRLDEFNQRHGDDAYSFLRTKVLSLCCEEDISVETYLDQSLQIQASRAGAANLDDANVRSIHHDTALKCFVACIRTLNQPA